VLFVVVVDIDLDRGSGCGFERMIGGIEERVVVRDGVGWLLLVVV